MVQSSNQLPKHANNFNIIRMIAAICVVVGHTGPIIGSPALSILGVELHTIGVQTLFLIGGFMVAKSWKRDPHFLSFYRKRFLRLWPPYAIMILIMTFLTGPLLSELGIKGYFQSSWKEYLKNLRFYIIFAQPGVFTNLIMPNVVNGSLWTMPVEAILYIVTPFVYRLFFGEEKATTRRLFLFLLCLSALNVIIYPIVNISWIFYATDWFKAGKLMIFYFIGMLYSSDEVKQYFNLQRSLIILIILMPLSILNKWANSLMMIVAIPYFMMSFALDSKPLFAKFGQRYELSYGIYLYGFFFQQLVCYWMRQNGIKEDYLAVTVISLILTIVAAWLSFVCVERPLLQIKRKGKESINKAE